MEKQNIAQELKIKLDSVESIINTSLSYADKAETKDSKIIHKTSGKKISGVSIMTESASQIADEHNKKISASNSRQKDCIYKIRDDK